MPAPNIINLADLEFHHWQHGERFEGRMGEIATEIGAEKLGYNLTVVPAGKRAVPFHSHHVIEEMFFVLEGEGEVRIGDSVFPIREGDVVNCPAGGPETAHQIINTMASGDLKYLAVSTNQFPDICRYPDSGKTLVAHRWPAADGSGEEQLRLILRAEDGQTDYWEDEK